MMKAKSSASIASCVNVVSMIQMQRKCILKDAGIVCNTRFVADTNLSVSVLEISPELKNDPNQSSYVFTS